MKRTVLVLLIIGFISFPGVLLAADPTCNGINCIVPCSGPDCTACSVMQLGQNILTWFIRVMALVIAVVFAVGGFKMVMAGGDTGKVSEARGMMTNAVIGFVILLAAWLIVDTVMKTFINPNVMGEGKTYGPWYKIQCVAQPAPTTTGTTTGGTVVTTPTPSSGQVTDAQARQLLADAGITVNKTAAQGTSLEGINAATIQDAIDLKKDCACTIIITGGTESTGGHAGGTQSHTSGYKYDMGLNNALNSYITTNFTDIGVRSDGARMYKASDGTIYARESNHWDVLVKS
jgi:hypothetical protein